MDRLFRPQYLTVALLMLVCLTLMILVLPRFPDKICAIPVWALILFEYIFSLGVTVCAQFQAIRQSLSNFKLAPGLICLGIGLLVTAIGVTFSPINSWGQDGTVSIGLVQLSVLNLAILFSIFILTSQGHPEFEESLNTQESTASNDSSIKRLTQIRIKAIHPATVDEEFQAAAKRTVPSFSEVPLNPSSFQGGQFAPVVQKVEANEANAISASAYQATSSGISQQQPVLPAEAKRETEKSKRKPSETSGRQAVDITTVGKLLIPPVLKKMQNPKRDAEEMPTEIRRLQSVNPSNKTQNKIDQTKKQQINSTISKLQALSASGTGAAHVTESGTDASDLKSVLDRLDNDVEAANLEESVIERNVPEKAPEVFGQSGAVFSQPVDQDLDSIFAKIAPEQNNEIAEPHYTEEDSDAYAVEEKSELLQENSGTQGVFKNKVDSDLDGIFSEMVPAEAQREINTTKAYQQESPSEQEQEESPTKQDWNESTSNQSIEGDNDPFVFAQPPVKDLDNIFAEITPEAKEEIGGPEYAEASSNSYVTENRIETPEENIEEQRVFKQKVDSDVDNIFSGMVPPEAQREVSTKFVNQIENPSLEEREKNVSQQEQEISSSEQDWKEIAAKREWEESSSKQVPEEIKSSSVFAQPIDNDLDDIFAKIAPEAKPEIGKPQYPDASSDPYVIESGIETLEENVVEQRVFKQKVDSDVDNIFSGMVSAEAQKEVSTSRAADPESPSKKEWQESPSKKDWEESPSKQEWAENPSKQMPEATKASSVFAQPIDKDVDNIFAKIAPEAKPEISKKPASSEITDDSLPIIKPQSSMSSAEESRLFKQKVDDQVDTIFSQMTSAEAQKELVKDQPAAALVPTKVDDSEITGDRATVVKNFDTAGTDQKSPVPELKDFGRLSSKASAEKESSVQAGTMKTIGKLLIDSDAVGNLIKKAESGKITINLPSAKVISKAHGQGIQSLLDSIDDFEGVEGSMLVGADGMVILSTLTTAADRDGTGVLANGMLGNSNIGTQKLDLGELEQMILITNASEGQNNKELTTVFTDVEVGVLAVFIDNKTIDGLDNLIEKISSIANG